ncbi:hypothetical protein FQN52_003406 [Onygenales sp. PD_12]|nr:hypothetical protein FQN52_003406 [Onygenales sp. PD_12]KAK2805151.1 hypothetical protein FQN51_000674 [Onygenales sp. PD_10]
MASNREERRLMRQRGAGNRAAKEVDFGFSFGTPKPQPSIAPPPPPSPPVAQPEPALPASQQLPPRKTPTPDKKRLTSPNLSRRTPSSSHHRSSSRSTPGSARNPRAQGAALFDIPPDDDPDQGREAKRRRIGTFEPIPEDVEPGTRRLEAPVDDREPAPRHSVQHTQDEEPRSSELVATTSITKGTTQPREPSSERDERHAASQPALNGHIEAQNPENSTPSVNGVDEDSLNSVKPSSQRKRRKRKSVVQGPKKHRKSVPVAVSQPEAEPGPEPDVEDDVEPELEPDPKPEHHVEEGEEDEEESPEPAPVDEPATQPKRRAKKRKSVRQLPKKHKPRISRAPIVAEEQTVEPEHEPEEEPEEEDEENNEAESPTQEEAEEEHVEEESTPPVRRVKPKRKSRRPRQRQSEEPEEEEGTEDPEDEFPMEDEIQGEELEEEEEPTPPPQRTKSKRKPRPQTGEPSRRSRQRQSEHPEEEVEEEPTEETNQRPTQKKSRKPKSSENQNPERERKPRGETVPVVVHRFANLAALQPLPEDEGLRDSNEPVDAEEGRNKYPSRSGVNPADVLGQICRETLEKTLSTLEDGISKESNTARRAEWTRKRKAVELFGTELEQRLFDMSELLDSNFVLSARLKRERKDMAALRNRLVELRKERGDIALKIDGVRRKYTEEENTKMEQTNLNNALHDLQLAIDRGRGRKADDSQVPDPAVGLEFLLRTVAQDVSSTAPGSHGGILSQIKNFNDQLERTAALLE